MPKSLAGYADQSKALEYRNRQRHINYYGNGRERRKRARKAWLPLEDRLILDHKMSDRELAKLLKRSIPAIQLRRHKLKKTSE